MIKNEDRSLHAPYYEQRLDNGLSVLFLPRKSVLKSAVIYVPFGCYPHEESINGTKIPFGTGYFLSAMIASPGFVKEMQNKGIRLTTSQDYSYTTYTLETLGDIFLAIDMLLKRILRLKVEEEDIVSFREEGKENFEKDMKDPFFLVEKEAVQNLFSASPIRKGRLPDEKESLQIHSSTLKKYLSAIYQGERLTLLISGNYTAKEVQSHFAFLPLRGHTTIESVPSVFEEDYTKAKTTYTTFRANAPFDILSFGLKFPKREELYNLYGDELFSFYEFLESAAFTRNEPFLSLVRSTSSDLLRAKLEQAGEETYLLLTFRTEQETKLANVLTNYILKIDTHVSHSLFASLKDHAFAKALASLSLPSTALKAFTNAYANNVAYPALAKSVSRMHYSDMKQFLSKMSSFPRAASYLKAIR